MTRIFSPNSLHFVSVLPEKEPTLFLLRVEVADLTVSKRHEVSSKLLSCFSPLLHIIFKDSTSHPGSKEFFTAQPISSKIKNEEKAKSNYYRGMPV